MATLVLPVTADPHYELTVSLEGVNYVLVTRYNERAGAWYLDIQDEAGTVLLAGKKILVEWPLTGLRDTDPALPPGVIFAYDTSGHQIDALLEDFGTRVLLCYEEAA